MNSSKLPLLFLVCLGFVCAVCGNPITSLFGKSSDDKADLDEKTTTVAKAAETTTTTTTPNPSSSCGGLKGFLHICDKDEPAEAKNVKTRSVPEEDSSEESDSDDDSDEKVKRNNEDDKADESKPTESGVEKRQAESEPVEEETEKQEESETEKEEKKRQVESDDDLEKRQVENTEEPLLESEPLIPPEVPLEAILKKRQVDTEEETEEENDRRRRDCRDGDGDYEKDCRKKRELVPPVEPKNKRGMTDLKAEAK